MGLFQKDVQIVEKPKINKNNYGTIKSLNGYDAIKYNFGENNIDC